MNLESGRMPLQDMKDKYRSSKETAAAVVPCVTVTERNWTALLAMCSTLEQMQTMILTDMKRLDILATKEDIPIYLRNQLAQLTAYTEEMKMTSGLFRQTMEETAKDSVKQMENAVQIMEKQAGKMRGQFSKNLSEVMEKTERKLDIQFWISLIPSGLLLLLFLAQHIFSWM